MSIQPQWIIYLKWKKKHRTKQYEFYIDNDILLKRRMEHTKTQTMNDTDNTEKCIVKSGRCSLIPEKEIPIVQMKEKSNNDQSVFVYPCRCVKFYLENCEVENAPL